MAETKRSLPRQKRSRNLGLLLERAEGTSPQGSREGSRKDRQVRAFQSATIRTLEGEGNERKFILSFSSEEPYKRYWGREILDHDPAAVDLTRLNTMGVLLFNHNRDKVMGRINRAWIENRRGMAEVEFDKDDASEIIYQKVKSGTLKGVSIGYQIGVIEEVMQDKVSTDGRFAGPCDVARQWQPYEISIVSVPADATVGVGREQEPGGERAAAGLSCFEAQVIINRNRR